MDKQQRDYLEVMDDIDLSVREVERLLAKAENIASNLMMASKPQLRHRYYEELVARLRKAAAQLHTREIQEHRRKKRNEAGFKRAAQQEILERKLREAERRATAAEAELERIQA